MTESVQYLLSDVNAMDKGTFVSVFGAVFEDSPWAAEQTYELIPFDSPQSFIDAMCQIVRDADQQTQLQLLRAHPELGANRPMADVSVKEQKGAGIRDAEEEKRRLMQELNVNYREKFNFPFIIAVKGLTPELILEHMQRRLQNDHDKEFKECLEQVFRIARIRLDDILINE